MATYIISDIHGDMLSFRKMLSLIEFDEKDFLVVYGDVLDRGEQRIEKIVLIKDMVEKGCALMLNGNHEFFCSYVYGKNSNSEKVDFVFGRRFVEGFARA